MTTYITDEDQLQLCVENAVKKALREIDLPRPEPISDRINKDIVKQMTGKSDQWVYQKTTKGCKDPLPFEKFGRELVFSRKAIQEYIDSHTRPIFRYSDVMADRLSESGKKKI